MLYFLMMILAMSFQKVSLKSESKSEIEETLSDEETNTLVTIDTDATNRKGQQKRRGPRKRGGISRAQLRQQAKKKEEEVLEAKWKEQDKATTVPPFTSNSKVNVPLSNFLDLFGRLIH